MPVEYGTLEPVEGAEKRSNKKAIAVAAVLVVSAVLALSFTLGATKTNSAVNSNLGRADVAIVDGEVKELFDYACANALTERFVLSTFDGKKTPTLGAARSKVIAAVTAKASDHWERDWEAFKNALSVMKVGYGVYNFPVWDEGDEGTTFAVMPTFVTYLDPNADIEWLYHGGSYLGGAAIAAKCTGKDMLRVRADDDYVTACTRLTGNEQACKAVVDDVCPFADTPTSPCYCDGETSRTDFVRQSINPECCDQIKAWCAQPANTQGCSTYAVEHYDSKCDEGYHDLERVQTLLLENFEDEDDLCLEECANSCKYVENNYKKCSACATNLATHTYASGSFAASCYPGAIGFVNHRCCGTGDSRQTCAAFSEANDCALVSHVDDGCLWMEHTECAAKITAAREAAEAQRLLDEAAAAEPEEEPAVEEEPVVVEEEIVPE